jgi:hypothetical protein
MSKIKHTFGQLLDSGKVNSYLVYYSGYVLWAVRYNPMPTSYLKKSDSGYMYAAFPVALRMKEKKFEKVKDNLRSFFGDYPEIAEKIKAIQQQDDYVNMVKRLE